MNFGCPDDVVAKGIYGGGFEIFGGNGSVLSTGLNMVSADNVSTWADEIHSGYPNLWNLTVYVICGS